VNIETGHFIRIQIPARGRTLWLSPAWAVVCGIVASSAFVWTGRDVLIAALSILLADGVWATIWWGLVETDWPALIARWPHVAYAEPEAAWPFARPGSPAERSQHWSAHFRAWWQTEVWPEVGTPVLSALVCVALGIVLSGVIGWQAMTLSLGAFALIQVGVILEHRAGLPQEVSHFAHGLLDVGLAWSLGQAAFGHLTPLSLAMALLFSIAYAASLDLARGGQRSIGWLLPQLLIVIGLVLLQQPLAAFMLGVLLIAQTLLATVLRGLAFAQASQFWLLLAMLVGALAIR